MFECRTRRVAQEPGISEHVIISSPVPSPGVDLESNIVVLPLSGDRPARHRGSGPR